MGNLKLNVDIGGNAAGFATALNKAKADASTFASDVSSGVFKNFNQGFAGIVQHWKLGLVAAVGGFGASLFSKFNEIQERAKQIKIGTLRTGLDADQYQRVQNVTESTGTDASAAAHAIDHIGKAKAELQHGSLDATRETDKLAGAFAALGVSVSEVERLSPQQLFFRIAEAMKDAASAGKLTAEQMAAVREVMGRGGMELMPAFAKGFEGNFKDVGNLSEADVSKLTKDSRALDGVKSVGTAYSKELVDLVGKSVSGWKLMLAALFDARPGGRLSTESGIELSPSVVEGRARLTDRQQRDRAAEAERMDQQMADKKFAAEAKKVEQEITAERLKQGTPEERRAALLADIKQHEQEIADIRAYQAAGAFSETEARLRIDREELEILKRKGALAEMDKKHERSEADKWVKLGGFDRDIYAHPAAAIPAPTAVQQAAAVNRNVDALEMQIAQGDERMNSGLMGEEDTIAWLRQREVLQGRKSAAERSLIRPQQSREPGFHIGSEGNTPPEASAVDAADFIGPLENLDALIERISAGTNRAGATSLVPTMADNGEAGRRTLEQLEQSNNALREMTVSLRRLETALA